MFGPSPDAATLVVPATPLDDLYAEPARTWLEERGSVVRANARARIVIDGGRVVGASVRGETHKAPVVIAAVPWFNLPSLFEPPPSSLAPLLTAASGTGASPIVTVNLWFDRRVMEGIL